LAKVVQQDSDPAEVYFCHTDMLGSIRAITDSSGEVAARFEYEPFGLVATSTGPLASGAHRFTGKPEDGAIGLYYFGARYYDPEVGRFTSRDSAKQGLNWYTYCQGNPLMLIDPDGYESVPAWLRNCLFGTAVHHEFKKVIVPRGYYSDVPIKGILGSGICLLRPDCVEESTFEVLELKPDGPGSDGRANAQAAKYVAASDGRLKLGNAEKFMAQFGGMLDLGVVSDVWGRQYRVTVRAGTGAALLYHAEPIRHGGKKPGEALTQLPIETYVALALAAAAASGGGGRDMVETVQ
jgi:RHS repeat-associated protein